MKRRARPGAVLWPPERLCHFRASDWPGKLAPELRPTIDACAACAFEQARGLWLDEQSEAAARIGENAALDPVLRCCPSWPRCGAPDPSPYSVGPYHWHDEWI